MGSGKTPNTGLNTNLIAGGSMRSLKRANSATNEWTKEITGLPAVDNEGNPYYYWVEEVEVPIGYSASYQDNSIDALAVVDSGETPTITITNTKSSESFILPETGGKGTLPYTVTGIAMMISSGTIIFFKRRYRERKRKSA